MGAIGDNRKRTAVWFQGAAIDRLGAVLVVAVATAFAAVALADYHAHADDLWQGVYHDRNGHLSAAVDVALSLKTFDLPRLVDLIYGMRIWGPVHALTLAGVFLVTGIDHRWAIIPSLSGWVATIGFSWAIARRLFADRASGMFAGALAVTWIIGSPTFRFLASDVMLEGLGAGLSAMAIWAYLRCRDDRQDNGRWRLLASVLTVLFFHKANYWGLTAASLALASLVDGTVTLRRPSDARRALQLAVGHAIRLMAHPLMIAFGLLAGLTAWIYWRGPTQIPLFGRNVSLYPPETLTTAAYAALFWRLSLSWRKHRTDLRFRLGVPGRNLFYWHVAPVAVSFLVPKRLAGFLWFVGPSNALPGAHFDLLHGAAFYWDGFALGFSVAEWSALLAVALIGVAVVRVRQMQPGWIAVFVFAALSTLAVVAHPQHQVRFLGSWIFAIWICAGAGGACLLHGHWWRQWPWARVGLAGLAAMALGVATAAQALSPLAAVYAIHPLPGPSDINLFRPALPSLAGARVIGIAATFGPSNLVNWVTQEACQCRLRFESPRLDRVGTRSDWHDQMAQTIASSKADRWIVIDAPGPAFNLPVLGLTYDRTSGMLDAMREQTRFRAVFSQRLPAQDAVVTVYAPAGK